MIKNSQEKRYILFKNISVSNYDRFEVSDQDGPIGQKSIFSINNYEGELSFQNFSLRVNYSRVDFLSLLAVFACNQVHISNLLVENTKNIVILYSAESKVKISVSRWREITFGSGFLIESKSNLTLEANEFSGFTSLSLGLGKKIFFLYQKLKIKLSPFRSYPNLEFFR